MIIKKHGACARDLNYFLNLSNRKRSACARDLFLSFSNLSNRKRSLSTVVATLLMVLLVVIAVGIVSQIVIPMIKKDLSSAGSCLDAMGNVKFNNEYTCYDKTNRITRVSIEVKKVQVSGFVVNIYSEGNSESHTIKEGLPKENEARVYEIEIITGIIPKTVKVSPIMGSETCEEMDQIILNEC